MNDEQQASSARRSGRPPRSVTRPGPAPSASTASAREQRQSERDVADRYAADHHAAVLAREEAQHPGARTVAPDEPVAVASGIHSTTATTTARKGADRRGAEARPRGREPGRSRHDGGNAGGRPGSRAGRAPSAASVRDAARFRPAGRIRDSPDDEAASRAGRLRGVSTVPGKQSRPAAPRRRAAASSRFAAPGGRGRQPWPYPPGPGCCG